MALIKKNSDRAPTDVPEKGATLSGKAGKATQQAEPEPKVQEETVTEEAGATSTASATTASAAAAPSISRSVAAPRSTAVSAPTLKMMDVLEECKGAYIVDWDTLDRVQANNGNFLDLGKQKAKMGEVIQLRLLSWQDNWQISPGVKGDEAAEYVRYSNDGKVTTKGEDCAEYLAHLKEMYKEAKMTPRVVLVGVLEGAEKETRLIGEMIQLDLSNTSKKEFDKYRLGCAYKVGKGVLSADAALLMTMKAEITSANGNDWTKVLFEPTILEGASA